MDPGTEMGAFLRSRRATVAVESVELPTYGRRRVPGLRREELATLAGVSVSYYTRIEQGQGGQVSPVVLDALAQALRLDADEREHLHRLARRPSVTTSAADRAVEQVRPGLSAIVAHLDGVPAGVLGRTMDILAWNRLCQRLFAEHVPFDSPADPATRPNWVRLLFLDPRCEERLVDWEMTALDMVGRLRGSAGRHPQDPALAELVTELCEASKDFDRMWATHPVYEKALGVQRLLHPEIVGEVELRDELLRSAEDPDQLLVTFHVEPGSPAEAALRILR